MVGDENIYVDNKYNEDSDYDPTLMSLDPEDRLVQIPSLIDNDNIQISKNTDPNKLKIPVL